MLSISVCLYSYLQSCGGRLETGIINSGVVPLSSKWPLYFMMNTIGTKKMYRIQLYDFSQQCFSVSAECSLIKLH